MTLEFFKAKQNAATKTSCFGRITCTYIFFAFALIFGCLKNYCHEKNNISPIASDRTISGNIIDQTQGWNIHGNDVPEQFKMDQHDMTYNAPVTIYIYILCVNVQKILTQTQILRLGFGVGIQLTSLIKMVPLW